MTDTWQSLGSAALRVVAQAERQRQAEKLFDAVPSDEDLRKLYPKKDSEGEAA